MSRSRAGIGIALEVYRVVEVYFLADAAKPPELPQAAKLLAGTTLATKDEIAPNLWSPVDH